MQIAMKVVYGTFLVLAIWACDDVESELTADGATDIGRPSLGPLVGDVAMDAAPPMEEAGIVDAAMVDAAAEQTLCQGEGNRGLLREPFVLFDSPAYAPRIGLGSDGKYGLLWLVPDEEGPLSTLYFGRLDTEGQLQGDPIALGASRYPQHRLVRNGDRFLVAWLNARRTEDAIPFKGVRVRAIEPDDTVTTLPDLEGSAQTEHLSFAWADFGTGMLVYTRGRLGEDGVVATPVMADLAYEATRPLTGSPASSPSVVYGDGTWGVSWLARDGEDPAELAFVRVDDLAAVQRMERRYPGKGVGNAYLAFGNQIYAVTWTRPGEGGVPRSVVSFLDGEGELLASPEVTGPEGFSLVTSLQTLSPLGFAIGYEESRPGGSRQVGISYGSTTQIVAPNPLPPAEGHAHQGLVSAGNQSRMLTVYSDDPSPSNTGYSREVRLVVAPIGPCQ